MLDALAAADSFEEFGRLIRAIGRRQNGYGIADRLLRRVAIDSACTVIPTDDTALQRLAEDSILG